MSAKDLYAELTTGLGLELAEKGFSPKGNSWVRPADDNWAIIGCQKSPKSTTEEIIFTIEYGIFSRLISDFFTPDFADKVPTLATCHWRRNLTALLSQSEQQWWTVANTQIQTLKAELVGHLNKLALPDLNTHLTDKQLGAAWFTGQAPGITEFQRLAFVSVILKNINRPNELMDVLSEMETSFTGKPEQAEMEAHLEKIL